MVALQMRMRPTTYAETLVQRARAPRARGQSEALALSLVEDEARARRTPPCSSASPAAPTGRTSTAGQATGALQQARAERHAELMGELGSASRSVVKRDRTLEAHVMQAPYDRGRAIVVDASVLASAFADDGPIGQVARGEPCPSICIGPARSICASKPLARLRTAARREDRKAVRWSPCLRRSSAPALARSDEIQDFRDGGEYSLP